VKVLHVENETNASARSPVSAVFIYILFSLGNFVIFFTEFQIEFSKSHEAVLR
jgi:hypothetical protein